jgi:perosamine synthetase
MRKEHSGFIASAIVSKVDRMRVQRTIPPAAAPIKAADLLHGAAGIFFPEGYAGRLESEIKKYFKVRHVFLVSSGKAALTLILLALKSLSDRRQVVIPAYTCFSVPSAIVKAGLEVTLCDIDPVSFDFDYKLLPEVMTSKTLCVVPDHLFGIPSDMERLVGLCKDQGVFVVEDAAQAMGGRYKGKMLGTVGDVGFFSLGRGKNITCGSGGVIVTNSDTIANAIAAHYCNLREQGIASVLKNFFQLLLMSVFIRPSLYWLPAGLPFLKLGETVFHKDFPIEKLSKKKAGILRHWQNRLDRSNRTRAETAIYWEKNLQMKSSHHATIPYLRLPVLMGRSEITDRIYSLSQKKGLGISTMYPTPVNEIEELKVTFNGKDFPSAKMVAERLLSIPTHHLLSEEDKESICKLFHEAVFQECPRPSGSSVVSGMV